MRAKMGRSPDYILGPSAGKKYQASDFARLESCQLRKTDQVVSNRGLSGKLVHNGFPRTSRQITLHLQIGTTFPDTKRQPLEAYASVTDEEQLIIM
jgi:hypothetical protein